MTENKTKPTIGETFNALWDKAVAQRREKDGIKVQVTIGESTLLVELTAGPTYQPRGDGKSSQDLKPRPEKITPESVNKYLIDAGVPPDAMAMLQISEHESGGAILIKLNGFLDKNWYKVANLIEKGLGGAKYDKASKQWVIEK